LLLSVSSFTISSDSFFDWLTGINWLNSLYCCGACQISVKVNGEVVLSDTTAALQNIWEETSFQLEQLQANPMCVDSERKSLESRRAPSYIISFDPQTVMSRRMQTLSAGCQHDLLFSSFCCLFLFSVDLELLIL